MTETSYVTQRFRIAHGIEGAVMELLAIRTYAMHAIINAADGSRELHLYGETSIPAELVTDIQALGADCLDVEPYSGDWASCLPDAPVELCQGVWIRGSHLKESSAAKHDALSIHLPPSTAFGDGRHPSTKMAAALLIRQELAGKRVLDLGCGTGVLGVLAGMRGASELAFADIDPVAVAEAPQLAAAHTEARCQSWEGDLLNAVPDAQHFDLIIANIYADLIETVLVDERLRQLCPAGPIIWSGIASARLADIEAEFAHSGEQVVERLHSGWWRAAVTVPMADTASH